MSYGTTCAQKNLEFDGEPTTNAQIRDFALRLLHADSESDAIQILKDAGYWDNHAAWRLYGDKEGNFAQVGNQQSYPEAAFVEKITNCIDSILLRKCLLKGINPESVEAPVNLRDAVAMFFEDRRSTDDEAGMLALWPGKQIDEESHNITIAATGGTPGRNKQNFCLTICDQGEGQSPRRMSDTILSLDKKNKQRIRFVQGKFNMGGTGALRFAGEDGLQLVISKRHAELADKEDATADQWAVTVVRREDPSEVVGEVVNSEFTYLAPVGSNDSPRHGNVLGFNAKTMPLMPEHNEAYKREVAFGTAIKLYEFQTNVGQSNVLMPDGLMYALDRLLPSIALPVRIHECRPLYAKKDKKTTPASFSTPISGLTRRLEAGKGGALEPNMPFTAKLLVAGAQMRARVYVFKENRAQTYLDNEGVIFHINGQSHGYLPNSVFRRPKKVGLPRLQKSMLVLIDCSNLSVRMREDLFMSSRDRLSEKPIRVQIEEEVMEMLKKHPVLQRIQNARRESDLKSKLSDDKPLEEVLNKVLRSSPALRTIFLAGQRLSKPFSKGNAGGGGDKVGTGSGPIRKKVETQFVGRPHPSFFELHGVKYGKVFHRNCEIKRRCRVKFNTDVENGYFDRARDKGTYEIEILDDNELSIPGANFALDEGDAYLSFSLPQDAKAGDQMLIQVTVDDSTLPEPFVNVISLHVVAKKERKESTHKPRPTKGGTGGGSDESNLGLKLPDDIWVETDDEMWEKYNFDPSTACHVISDSKEVNGKQVIDHVFYLNRHNTSLLTEMKYSKQDSQVMESKFRYANILLGLAMLHADKQSGSNTDDDEVSVQDKIREYTRAVAPVLLPIIDQLSGLDESELEEMGLED